MFCVECGKDGPIFRDGVCLNCYLKTHTFTSGPDIIDMPVCSHCNSYKYKNNWVSDIFSDVIRRVIKNKFDISRQLKKIDINTDCKETPEAMECKVYITGFIDDVEITEEHDLTVRLKRTVCDVCSKKFGGYHEAIIQIRADKKKLTGKELKNIRIEVENLVESLRAKGNRNLFITDIGEEHGGLDFYISDKGVGLVIAKKIQGHYGGEIKQSSKNIGMKDGKQLYRMTYLLRLPSYSRGDFIQYNKSYHQIISIQANKIKIKNLGDWEEHFVDSKEIDKAKILGSKELVKEVIVVNETEAEIQIMNEKNYDVKIIRKPKSHKFNSEKIYVVKIDDQFFLLDKN